jgi:metal-responsive CopG/Arc/MetJ family transcriptional regulator
VAKEAIITFKVDPYLLEAMDLAAQKLRITRSELIRRAITYYLAAIDVSEMIEEVIGNAP